MSQASSYDALYLSPHLDDAVFSCGGQLDRFVRSGQRILLLTPLAADAPGELSPLAEELHRIWGAGDVMTARRREDSAACQVLGVEAVHWDLPDAIYRRHPASGQPLYPSLDSLRGKPAEADAPRVAELAERLARLPPARRVCVPLGAGGHVDHLLARHAAERAFGRHRLEYYEDFPYARKRWVLTKALGWPWRWQARVWRLDDDALDAKCRAIECYASQLGTAFKDLQDMRRQVAKFSWRAGGERLWWPRHP